MGSIISAVAALEIHIERKAEAIKTPSTMLRRLLPIRLTMESAIRRCRFQRSMAMARMKPPMYI